MSKKRKFEKRIIAFFMIVVISVMSWTVVPKAEILRDGDYNYTVLDDGTVEIEGYLGCDSDIIIPNIIEGKNVTCIGKGAFSGCSGLRSINIPAGVCNIREDTFSGCNSLEKMEVDEKNPYYYSEGNCIVYKHLQKLIAGCKNTIIPENVKSIGDCAFSGCSELKYIVIPKSVTCIGDSAFYGCTNLSSVKLPDAITNIGDSAFYGCTNLSSIKLPEAITNIGEETFFKCTSLKEIIISDNVTSIEKHAFAYCSSLESVSLPKNLKAITNWAFYNCSAISSIIMPASVEDIGNEAFLGCTNLSNIEVDEKCTNYYSEGNCIVDNKTKELILGCKNTIIPSSVKKIGAMAFYLCGIKAVVIPEGVTSIGYCAFGECSELTSISIPASMTDILKNGQVFYACSNLSEIYVNEKNDTYYSQGNCIITKDKKLIVGCKNSIIPEDVTAIAYNAFGGNEGLTDIVIPSSVENVGNYVFAGCHNLSNVKILPGVKCIGSNIFFQCKSLKDITIPDSVESIDSFLDNDRNPITIHASSGSYAAAYAKEYGYNLIIDDADPSPTEPTKPDTTTQQPQETQTTQQQSTTETAPTTATAPTTEASPSMAEVETTLEVTNADCKVRVTSVSQENPTAEYVAAKNKKASEIQIPDSVTVNGITYKVTAVAKNAFSGNKKVKKIVIGKNVTSIGKNAFANCKNLKTIVVKSTKLTKKSIAKNVLKGTSKKLTIKVPKNKLAAYKKYFKGKGNKTVRVKK